MPGGAAAVPRRPNTGINMLYYQTLAYISQARASAAPPGKTRGRGAAFMPGGAAAVPRRPNTGINML